MLQNNGQKIALVTGGSRGLGKDIAISLAKKGIDVILTYNSSETEAKKVVEAIESLGRKAAAFQLDIGAVKTFDGFFSQVVHCLDTQWNGSRLDFLINNAGTSFYALFTDVTEQQLDEAYAILYKGVFLLTQQLLPYINNGGGIVNVSSVLARTAFPGTAVYASMKGAVEVFTRYLAKELGTRSIRSNVVAPGPVETDFGGGHIRDDHEMNAQIAGITALGRVGLPDDIGGVVAFLCTDDAKWITGQCIEISGGMML